VKKTKESVSAVFSWQYLNCLRCWAAAVSAYPSDADQLGSLAYPLVQVAFTYPFTYIHAYVYTGS